MEPSQEQEQRIFAGCNPYECTRPHSSNKWTVVRAQFLLPLTDENPEERIEDGYVLVEGGKLKEVGHYTIETGKRIIADCQKDGGLTIVGCGAENVEIFPDDVIPRIPGVLMPGFVKAHGHDHESPIIGLNKEAQLVEWLDKCVNLFTSFMNEQRDKLMSMFGGLSPNLITYRKARLDDLTFGITTAMTHHCNHNKYRVAEIVQANQEAGTKMIVAVGSQDRCYDPRILDIPATLATERLDEYWKLFMEDPRIVRTRIVPGPDQIFSNSGDLLAALKKWAREHDTLIHIHSSEEPGTTKWFTETQGCTPVEYADKFGFLDERTVIAHQVNCTEHDLEILRDRGVKIAHNPLANTILSSGMPPVTKMIEMGIPVAISTDGSGSADSQNIVGAMRATAQYFRGLERKPRFAAIDALRRVTAIPAKFLEIPTGQLRPGYCGDWIVIDTTVPNMTPTHLENVAENILWAASGNEVRYVCSEGVLLRDDYRYVNLGFNWKENLCQVRRLTAEMLEYRKHAKEIVATGARSAQAKKEEAKE